MKILVADDSPVIRAALTSILEEQGYEVESAEDGIETIQKFYSERPDLVVLDLQMPRMTGYMACRLLKDDWSSAHIPVLILTAHDSTEDRYWADKSGADGYLTKEELGDDLLSAIKSALVSRALSELGGTETPSHDLEETDVLSRLTEMLDRKLFESTIANDIMTLSARSYDLEGTANEILFIIRRFVGYDIAAVSVVNEPTVMVRADRPIAESAIDSFVDQATTDLKERAGSSINPGDLRVVVSESDRQMEAVEVDGAWPSVFSTTLRLRNQIVGTLTLASVHGQAYGPQVARTLRTIESSVATVVDSALQHRRRMQDEARQSLSSLYSFEEEAS